MSNNQRQVVILARQLGRSIEDGLGVPVDQEVAEGAVQALMAEYSVGHNNGSIRCTRQGDNLRSAMMYADEVINSEGRLYGIDAGQLASLLRHGGSPSDRSSLVQETGQSPAYSAFLDGLC